MTTSHRRPQSLTDKSLLPTGVLAEALGAEVELIRTLIANRVIAPVATVCVPHLTSLYCLGDARRALATYQKEQKHDEAR